MGRLLPMGLNIKNERVCALAREVAARSGQTQTGAIESALEAYLRRLLESDEKDRQRRETERDTRLRQILELVESLPDPDPGAPSVEEIMDELYDPATGVPR